MAREDFKAMPPQAEIKEKDILTVSEMSDFFYSLVETSGDYPFHYKTLMEGLKGLYDRGFLKFGPDYEYKSKSLNLKMLTMFVDYNESSTHSHRNFIVLTKDSSGNIVADFYQPTIFSKKTPEITANGLIVVDTENSKGMAMPTSLVTWNLLQMEANIKNSKLRWFLQNSNSVKLKSLQKEYEQTKDQNLLSKIKEADEQQKRWKAMYGSGGKLNVGKDETKILSPKDEEPYEDFDSIDLINLERVDDDDDYSHPKILNYKVAQSQKEKDALKDRKIMEFNQLLEGK